MKIRTPWTATYKIPRLVSCNALLGHTAASARVRCAGVRFVVRGQHGLDLMMPAPECADKMPGQHSRPLRHTDEPWLNTPPPTRGYAERQCATAART
jgi:hypothetical protein